MMKDEYDLAMMVARKNPYAAKLKNPPPPSATTFKP
jgi:hypothetical protein